jgi:hypothetical protein
MPTDERGEEYIDFRPTLTTYYIRCLIHHTWDCPIFECQEEANRKIENLIKEAE